MACAMNRDDDKLVIKLSPDEGRHRQCGGCTLCCKLTPVRSMKKPSGTKCQHQRFNGCAIYARRPADCATWFCRWLINDDAADLSRPDRAHYVIDMMPDYVVMMNGTDGTKQHIPVVQIWVDPKHPDAHRDPALRRYLVRRGEQGFAAIIRYSEREGFALFPPNIATDGKNADAFRRELLDKHIALIRELVPVNEGIAAQHKRSQ